MVCNGNFFAFLFVVSLIVAADIARMGLGYGSFADNVKVDRRVTQRNCNFLSYSSFAFEAASAETVVYVTGAVGTL